MYITFFQRILIFPIRKKKKIRKTPLSQLMVNLIIKHEPSQRKFGALLNMRDLEPSSFLVVSSHSWRSVLLGSVIILYYSVFWNEFENGFHFHFLFPLRLNFDSFGGRWLKQWQPRLAPNYYVAKDVLELLIQILIMQHHSWQFFFEHHCTSVCVFFFLPMSFQGAAAF